VLSISAGSARPAARAATTFAFASTSAKQIQNASRAPAGWPALLIALKVPMNTNLARLMFSRENGSTLISG
jgi:hypothetical protein